MKKDRSEGASDTPPDAPAETPAEPQNVQNGQTGPDGQDGQAAPERRDASDGQAVPPGQPGPRGPGQAPGAAPAPGAGAAPGGYGASPYGPAPYGPPQQGPMQPYPQQGLGPYGPAPYGQGPPVPGAPVPGLYGAGGPRDATLEAFVSGAAYAALGLLGAIVGVVGSFAQAWTVGSVPVAAIVLVVLNFAIARSAGWAMGRRMAAAVPVLLWAAVALVLSIGRSEGDLIVPGTLPGYLFIIGGLAAGALAVSLVPAARPSGSWLTRGVTPADRPGPSASPAPGRPPESGSA